MPNRPMTEPERAICNEKIKQVREDILIKEGYLAKLLNDLERGVWYSDIDYSSLPKPEPSCYLCYSRIPIISRCKLPEHEYGKVCKDYMHFLEQNKERA